MIRALFHCICMFAAKFTNGPLMLSGLAKHHFSPERSRPTLKPASTASAARAAKSRRVISKIEGRVGLTWMGMAWATEKRTHENTPTQLIGQTSPWSLADVLAFEALYTFHHFSLGRVPKLIWTGYQTYLGQSHNSPAAEGRRTEPKTAASQGQRS